MEAWVSTPPRMRYGASEWYRSLRRGVVLGLVLALHSGLVLFLLAARAPLWQRPMAARASRSDALQVVFVAPATVKQLKAAVAAVEPLPPVKHRPDVRPMRASASRSIARMAPRDHAAERRSTPAMTLDLSLPSPTRDDAPSRWHEAVQRAREAHLPRLPGAVAGSVVQQIRLPPPASIKDSLRSIGTYLSCSAIKIQQEQQGHSMRLDKAAAEAGCGQN